MLEAALVATIIGFLTYIDRQNKRHAEQVSDLIFKVQAPKEAVMERQVSKGEDMPAVDPFNDEEYFEAQQKAMDRIAELERSGIG